MSGWLHSPEGMLERPVQATRWDVPERIDIEGKFMYWEQKWLDYSAGGDEFQHYAAPSRGMLERFTSLDPGDPTKILAYARRWGLLNVARTRAYVQQLLFGLSRSDVIECPEDLREPSRNWYARGNDYAVIFQHHFDRDSETRHGWEPLYVWRYWLRQISASLRVASSLIVQECPRITDWQVLFGLPDLAEYRPSLSLIRRLDAAVDGNPKFSESERLWLWWRLAIPEHFDPENARMHFYALLRQWQRIGGVNLAIDPLQNRLVIKTRSLFSGLVWQVMAASCTSGGISICSACGRPYAPERLPVADTRHYCPNCRKAGTPQRDAVRAHRERQRSERLTNGKAARK